MNTPEMLSKLEENEVFVFGSNTEGRHCGGAAAFALQNFGAVYGKGEGLFGKSYALPTADGKFQALPINKVKAAIDRFVDFAKKNPQLHFYLTKVGCGIAGFSIAEIARCLPLAILKLENVSLPKEFEDFLVKQPVA